MEESLSGMIMRNEEALANHHQALRIGYSYREGYIFGTTHSIASCRPLYKIKMYISAPNKRSDYLLHMHIVDPNGTLYQQVYTLLCQIQEGFAAILFNLNLDSHKQSITPSLGTFQSHKTSSRLQNLPNFPHPASPKLPPYVTRQARPHRPPHLL
jgi:hypothetical protein